MSPQALAPALAFALDAAAAAAKDAGALRDVLAGHLRELGIEGGPAPLDGGLLAPPDYSAGLGADRQRLGAFYTPPDVARRLAQRVLGPWVDAALLAADPAAAVAGLVVWDPACGDGVWLRAALDILAPAWAQAHGCAMAAARHEVAARSLYGTDIDPGAVVLARLGLACHADPRAPPLAAVGHHVGCGDGLLDPAPATVAFVLGNPPFLGQLKGATAHDRARRDRLRLRFGASLGPYTDASALFLLAALDAVASGGVVCLIQPRSLLATRDAAGVRGELLARATLTGLWLGGRDIFDAQVDVIAPVLVRNPPPGPGPRDVHAAAPQPPVIARWRGRDVDAMAPVEATHLAQRPTWSSLAIEGAGLPAIHVAGPNLLEQHCTATADFRDQYYGLQGRLVEDAEVPETSRDRFPLLVTAGLIDLARCRWGELPTRVHGRAWQAPRVDRDRVAAETKLGPWLVQRLVPKIVVATQTRVLEPWVDEAGAALPSVPCLTVVPRVSADLWQIAAALASPVLTVLAVRDFGGTALSSSAIKLAAAQVLILPAPSKARAWRDGALAMQAAQHATSDVERQRALVELGHAMAAAYAVPRADRADLVAWWLQRQARVRSAPGGRGAARTNPA